MGFYESLLKEDVSWRPKIRGLNFNQTGEEMREWMGRAIEEEEVKDTVESCTGDEVLGPIGFLSTMLEDYQGMNEFGIRIPFL